ncbi:NUDIX domain-containing protein [Patescibacteria group bacterium]|nr:NUDIX domain-containing protein [Patescibacteria group bacterium]
MLNEKSCGVVVFSECKGKNMKFLLLHYPQGHWEFPKGHVEDNENEKETALRELEEETGIKDVNFIDGFREVMNYKFIYDDKMISKDVVFFLGVANCNNVDLSHEHKGYDWLEYDDAMQKVTFKNARLILHKAKEFLESK